MYVGLLFLHSWLRWLVLIFGVWALLRAFAGMGGRRLWTPRDNAAGQWFTITLDLQLLAGLVLYGGLSPFTIQAFANMAEAMRNPVLRFWAVEHISVMVTAIVLAHIGRARTKRLSGDVARHRAAAIFYSIAFLLVLIGIPWPFMSEPRPLFRLLGGL